VDSKNQFILAIDQSTSASKVMLFNQKAERVKRLSYPHKQHYPREGFVEHDAVEIYDNVVQGLRQIITETRIPLSDVAGIAITNQRETALIWDKTTGQPVAHAVVWQCQRGADFCQKLLKEGFAASIQEKTGLIIDPYFSASKLTWLMNNIPGLKEKAARKDLLLGTMDSWLLWKLTNGKVHATDYSNACRTLLFNIHTLEWDRELIDLFGLNDLVFPDVKFSDEIFGYTNPDILFDVSLPIAGLIGDSHGALFGHTCFEPGLGKVTYGTGSSIMMNIGTHPLPPPGGLVTSIGFGCNKKMDYVYEGNIHCTGDTLNWLKNELELISDISEAEPLATSVKDNNGVYLVPAFVGLGAPYWDNNARATISGIPRDTTKAHVVRAALESIAYQVTDIVDLMGSREEINVKNLHVDGGPTQNNFLMQFQADMIRSNVIRSGIEEVSALGAAFLAGLAFGFWKNLEEIKNLKKKDRTFRPEMPASETEKLYAGWKKAVERTRME
jgi:glycerol kinase